MDKNWGIITFGASENCQFPGCLQNIDILQQNLRNSMQDYPSCEQLFAKMRISGEDPNSFKSDKRSRQSLRFQRDLYAKG